MCGITGVLGFDNTIKISETKLRNMAYSLKYRGSDKEFSSIPYRYLLNNSTNKYITKNYFLLKTSLILSTTSEGLKCALIK